jgi:hypothetical protein
MAMDAESTQETQGEDNCPQDPQVHETQEIQEAEDKEADEEKPTTQCATGGEFTAPTPKENAPAQADAQVRDGVTPTTTSDDDLTTTKPIPGNKIMKNRDKCLRQDTYVTASEAPTDNGNPNEYSSPFSPLLNKPH